MPKPLPGDDHVVRFVKNRLLRRGDEDDVVVGALPQAFFRRPDEEYLSVTWVQHFSSDYELGLRASAAAMRSQLTIKPRDGFSTGKVGRIAEICVGNSCRVRILHEPEPPENPGHSAIRGLPAEDMDLFALLADEAFIDTRLSATLG